ncbi:MAG: ABC transporter substrate-binding protein [Alicyclobacillaceae bacterium]|nr:ABC transporter substrate-binding protein [Alicyclobacillaceae bacterium]
MESLNRVSRFLRIRKAIAAVAIVAAALAVTACGAQTAPAPNSSPSGAGGTQPIRIGYSPWPGWFIWAIVKEKDLFKKHQANAELVWFPVYSDSLQALSTGNIDANSQTLSDTLAPASKGKKLAVVLVNDNSAGGDGLVAKPQYSSVQDLKGKVVATEMGTVDHMLLLTALDRNGMTQNDIQYTNMTVNDAGPAFIAGRLDAAVLWEPFLSKAIGEGKGKLLFSSKDVPGLIPDLLVFRREIVDQRPEDVRRILEAWFDALQFFRDHPDEAIAIMAKAADVSPEEFKKSLSGVHLFSRAENLEAFRPGQDFKSLLYTGEKTAQFLKQQGMLDSIPNVKELLEPKFVEQLSAWP